MKETFCEDMESDVPSTGADFWNDHVVWRTNSCSFQLTTILRWLSLIRPCYVNDTLLTTVIQEIPKRRRDDETSHKQISSVAWRQTATFPVDVYEVPNELGKKILNLHDDHIGSKYWVVLELARWFARSERSIHRPWIVAKHPIRVEMISIFFYF